MTTILPSQIKTEQEAKDFLTALNANGECFHPDDDPRDFGSYGPFGMDEFKPFFTEEEAKQLDKLMEQVLDIEGFDSYLFILKLDPDYVFED